MANDRAIRLSSTGSIPLGNGYEFGRSSYTVEFWVCIDAKTSGTIFCIDLANNAGSFQLSCSWGVITVTYIRGPGTATKNIAVQTYFGWYHLAFQYDAQLLDMRMLVNGERPISNLQGELYSAIEDGSLFYLGKGMTTDTSRGSFTGIVSELRIWKYVRPPAEIRADMYRRLNGGESNLALYLPLDDDPATLARNAKKTLNAVTGSATSTTPAAKTITGGSVYTGPTPLSKVAADAIVTPNRVVAADFNGSTSTIRVPSASQLVLTQRLLVEAWVRPTGTNQHPSKFPIISKLGTSQTGNVTNVTGWELRANSNRASFIVAFPSGVVETTAQLVPGAWSHVAALIDDNSMALYVNGQTNSVGRPRSDSGTAESILDSGGALTIGSAPGTSRAFLGQIAEVRVWSSAGSSHHLALQLNMFLRTANATGGLDATGFPALVAQYALEGDATDKTTNANHGTATDITWIPCNVPLSDSSDTALALANLNTPTARIATLQSQVNALTTEQDNLRTDNTNLAVERDGLRTEKTNLTTERDRLNGEKTTLTTEKANLTNQVNALTTERDNLRTDNTNLAVERDGLRTEKTNLTTERDRLNGEKTTLTTERDTLRTDKATLTTEKTNLTIERDGLRTERNNLTTERDRLNGEKTTLTTEKTNLTIERDGLRTDRNNLTIERDRLNGEKTTLTTEKTNLTIERDGLRTERNNLTTERDRLNGEKTTLTTEKTNLTIERDRLIGEKANLTTERDGLRTERNNLTTERDGLRTERNNLTIERDGLRTERNNLTIERDGLRTDKATLNTEKASLTNQVNALTTERDTLRTDKATLTTEKANLTNQVNALTTERDRLNGEKTTLTNEKTNLTAERDGLRTERNNLTIERDRLNGEKNTLTTEKTNLTNQVNALMTERDTLSTDKATLTTEREAALTRVTEKITETTNLTNQISTLTSQIIILQGDINAANGRLQVINEKNVLIRELEGRIRTFEASLAQTSIEDFVKNANNEILRARDALNAGGGQYALGRVALEVKMMPGVGGTGMKFPSMDELRVLGSSQLSTLNVDFEARDAGSSAANDIIVPTVLGYTEVLARRKLVDANLLVEVNQQAIREVPGHTIEADRVVNQFPKPGEKVLPGSYVSIFVGRKS